jgi:prevent-host-death family protein
MDGIWQIQDAKNKLSEVITLALTQGPQLITKHGEKTVVVLSYIELSEFFRASPLAGVDLSRDKSLPRDGLEL